MAQVSSEFIFFKVKCDVEPEDPASELGEGLMRVFRATKQQSGHHSSAWGRTLEDPKMLVWVIEWTDARCAITSSLLRPFLVQEDQPITAIYATMSPPISSTDTLTKNPVTELCFLAFPNNMSACETRQLDTELINFRTALVVRLAQETGPRSWSMGHVDRPSTIKHSTSPTGLATVRVLAVGWESMEAHNDAKKTKEFVDAIAPIREKLLLPPVPDLEVKHVRFQKV